MPDSKPNEKSNQLIQQELIELAEKSPGVAEVIKAYESLAPHIPSIVPSTTTKISYGTGANK